MASREDLIATLAGLDPATFEEVVSSAYRKRYERDDPVPPSPPSRGATSEEFARWLAARHLSSDPAIEKVVYLPAGAPADEIRLLEVNRFLNAPEPDSVEPLDFTPDTDSPFKVFVADVTGDQWERIQGSPEAMLPARWALEGNLIFGRV